MYEIRTVTVPMGLGQLYDKIAFAKKVLIHKIKPMFFSSIVVHCIKAAFLKHCSSRFQSSDIGVCQPRFEPVAAGLEERMLPLCFADPQD